MADRLDEQLHETRGGVFSHSISPPALARRLPLVPGETCMHTGKECTYADVIHSNTQCNKYHY